MQCSNVSLICIEHEFEKDESSTWTPPPQKQKQQQQKKKKKKKKKNTMKADFLVWLVSAFCLSLSYCSIYLG